MLGDLRLNALDHESIVTYHAKVVGQKKYIIQSIKSCQVKNNRYPSSLVESWNYEDSREFSIDLDIWGWRPWHVRYRKNKKKKLPGMLVYPNDFPKYIIAWELSWLLMLWSKHTDLCQSKNYCIKRVYNWKRKHL